MDSLARDPDKFITPHNADTGETILHLLAKEGKMEILQNLLDDSRVEKDLVRALLKQVHTCYSCSCNKCGQSWPLFEFLSSFQKSYFRTIRKE